MAAPSKPGVDWNEIHRLYTQHSQQEMSLNRIAELHGVSRPAIAKRAKRAGWKRPGEKERLPSAPTGLAISCVMPSPETADCIIDWVKDCVPLKHAAGAVGMSEDDLKAWLEVDPDFASRIDVGQHEAHATLIRRVNEAGARGDVKADQWLLERLKETRDEFTPTRQQGTDVGGITVTINVPVPQLVAVGASPIVDITATDAEGDIAALEDK